MTASSSLDQHRKALDDVPRQMLKKGIPLDRQKLAEDAGREIGQALDYAIDRAHSTKGCVSAECGYTDQSIVGRWIRWEERPHLDKLKAHSRKVYVEFLLALLQMEEGVEVSTQVTLRRVG